MPATPRSGIVLLPCQDMAVRNSTRWYTLAMMARAGACSAVSWQFRHSRQLSHGLVQGAEEVEGGEVTHGRVAMLAALGFIVQVTLQHSSQ